MAFFSDLNYLKPTSGALLEDISDVYQAIYTLFGTKKGSRLFRPTYGANLSRYLFEPCDEISARSMMYDIMTAIKELPHQNARFFLNQAARYAGPELKRQNHQLRILCFLRQIEILKDVEFHHKCFLQGRDLVLKKEAAVYKGPFRQCAYRYLPRKPELWHFLYSDGLFLQ